MKRALAALLCRCRMCVLSAAAEPDVYTLGDYQYTLLPDGTAEIVRYTGHDRAVVIPSALDGHPVVSIGESAFEWNAAAAPAAVTPARSEPPAAPKQDSAPSVRIPGTLSGLGLGDFMRRGSQGSKDPFETKTETAEAASYAGPEIITVPYGVTYIDSRAFYGCPATALILPESLTGIGSNAFAHSALTEITIPASVTGIGQDIFEGCADLTVFVFPGSFAERYCRRVGIPCLYAAQ